MLENHAPRCTVFNGTFHPAIKKNTYKIHMLDIPNTKFVISNLRLRKKKRLNFKYLLGKTMSHIVKSNAELELQKPQCVPLLSLTIWKRGVHAKLLGLRLHLRVVTV